MVKENSLGAKVDYFYSYQPDNAKKKIRVIGTLRVIM